MSRQRVRKAARELYRREMFKDNVAVIVEIDGQRIPREEPRNYHPNMVRLGFNIKWSAPSQEVPRKQLWPRRRNLRRFFMHAKAAGLAAEWRSLNG